MCISDQIGDIILTPREIMFKNGASVPQHGDRIDYFFLVNSTFLPNFLPTKNDPSHFADRFGRIYYIVIHNHTFHIEWFYHGSPMIMDEIAHP